MQVSVKKSKKSSPGLNGLRRRFVKETLCV
jgi:hypothetical protein